MKNPPDQKPFPETATILPASPNPAPPSRGWFPHGLGTWLLSGFLLVVLAGLFLPLFSTTCVKGPQTKSLAQAKQIGLALKLFAADHDGNYPRQGVPVEMKDAPQNSNQAWAPLFPTYVQSEAIFNNPHSAYQQGKGGDGVIDPQYTGRPVQTLRPGENVYGYVAGLTEDSRPDAPLVVDGTDGTGHYVQDRRSRGGTWEGKKAVVIRLDNSGTLENLSLVGGRLQIRRSSDDPKSNLLDIDYLGKDVRYLDPAVPGQ